MAHENRYSIDQTRERLKTVSHRHIVGGLWDEIGNLQFEALLASGLQQSDFLVDVGCGAFRGGRYFIDYLKPRHYFGIDISQDLIDRGLSEELDEDLLAKVRHDSFNATCNFEYPTAWPKFDYAVAISLFTHLNKRSIKACLHKTRGALKSNGKFLASVFLVPPEHEDSAYTHVKGIVTNRDADPYHQTKNDLVSLAEKTGFKFKDVIDFGHPRQQFLAIFESV